MFHGTHKQVPVNHGLFNSIMTEGKETKTAMTHRTLSNHCEIPDISHYPSFGYPCLGLVWFSKV